MTAPKRFDVATGLTSPSRYLASLGCDIRMPAGPPMDGARMHRVDLVSRAPEATHAQVPDVERHAREEDAGHFVILACTKHDHHQGHQLIARSFPAGWVCFAQFHSPYYGFDAFHYGPPLPKEPPR